MTVRTSRRKPPLVIRPMTGASAAAQPGAEGDTALRDTLSLVEGGVLTRAAAGGRSTSYSLRKI